MRRSVCRLTAKGVNQLVLDLLRRLHEQGPQTAGATTTAFLAEQRADARLWPDDRLVTSGLAEEPVYKNLLRARVRMVLEALEDDLRSPKSEPDRCPRGPTIEHVMPQAWSEHWGTDIEGDEAAAPRRDRLVHTLGNLTLVSKRLNPALSNRPWTGQDSLSRGLGDVGKRAVLLEHSHLKLNAQLVAGHESAWTQDDMRERTQRLARRICSIWSRDAGPLPTPQALEREEPPAVPEPMAEGGPKYEPLTQWLSEWPEERLDATFADVEAILGFELPPSARNYLGHWYGRECSALCRAIRAAGWKATGVNLTAERVGFVRGN